MAATLELAWDSRDLAFWRNRSTERALAAAVSKAGGDAARFLRSGSSRLLRQRKSFKASTVSKAMDLKFPADRGDISSLEWRLDVTGDTVPVMALHPRPTRRGVTFTINRGKRSLIGSAFIATMRSGHKGVFLRRGSARFPIDEAFTTRVTDVFNDNDFIPYIQAGAQVKFATAFGRLLPLELAKLK